MTQAETDRHLTDTDKYWLTEADTSTQRQTQTESHRHKQTQTDTNGHRQKQTDRTGLNRHRPTENIVDDWFQLDGTRRLARIRQDAQGLIRIRKDFQRFATIR